MLAIILGILCFLLAGYIILTQIQLRSINRQLKKRMNEQTRQPISLELFNKELNNIAININNFLKSIEKSRIDSVREEKHFKEMIANVSHDLRTPLTVIKGYQQLIEKGELSDEQRKKLKIAQKHVDELGNLIEHFFEYSCLLSDEPHPVIERVNLTNIVIECLADAVNSFEKNNIAVDIAQAPFVFADADKEMVTRIIQNLIRNCIQHSAGNLSVRLYVDGDAVISFCNPVRSGCEIDTARLFDRFYTGDSSCNKSTGLGLAIIKLLAVQMGGSVKAESADNMLDIQVRLPLCEAQLQDKKLPDK